MTGAFLAVTTAATAYQDVAAYSGIYVEPTDRWRAHLIEIATGSTFDKVDAKAQDGVTVASLDYSVGLQSTYDVELMQAEPTIRVVDTVVKAERGDRPFAKTLAARKAMEEAVALQAKLLEPVGVSDAIVKNAVTTSNLHEGAGLPAQLAAFQKRETVRDAIREAAPTERQLERIAKETKLARVKTTGRFAPTQFTVKSTAAERSKDSDVGVRGSILAYAPAEPNEATPFDALLSPSAPAVNTPEMAIATPVTPTKRPRYVEVPSPKSPIRLSSRDHKWADDPLPRRAFSKKERKCLATGIYFEARGEPTEGQQAVAQVILNRVRAPAFPDSICGVVYHNQHMRNRCQFSFTCDGIRDRVNSKKHWKRAQKVANDLIDGEVWLRTVGSSTHYHADYVSPPWRRKMTKLDKIGRHIFYRTKNGGWG